MQKRSFPRICEKLAPRVAGSALLVILVTPASASAADAAQSSAASETVPAEADSRAKFAEALKLFSRGDAERSLPLFRQAAEVTGSPNAHLYVGYCLAQLGQRVEAYRAFA